MVVPDLGQLTVVMQNRDALGGTVAWITAGISYWTSSVTIDFSGTYGMNSSYTRGGYQDWQTLRVRCVR